MKVTIIRLVIIALALLWVCAACAQAARITDPFNTDPGANDHKPFLWDINTVSPDAPGSWAVVDGALHYKTTNANNTEARFEMFTAGLEIDDDTNWSVETAFKHISGIAPHPTYETVMYARWNSKKSGYIGLLYLCYDANNKSLLVGNGDRNETPIPVDMTGSFRQVRMTVKAHEVRIYVDRKLAGGPYPLGSLKLETGPERFILGPIAGGQQPHSIHCAWDYFAVTTNGAFSPESNNWNPSTETLPIGVESSSPDEKVDPMKAFRHAPYANIKVLPRVTGRERFDKSLPREVVLWNAFNASKAQQLQVSEYKYPDTDGPTLQNFYRDTFPVKLDDRRVVAMLHITRGIGDTATGFLDYKMWYCVSTDGGKTYDKERPLIQRGAQYSAQHPNRYVHIGKNGFVFATLQPYMVKMTNGQIFLPCYYAPLDKDGKFYNPDNLPCNSNVFGLIGTWNNAKNDVDWDVTDPIFLPPDQSKGGLSESGVIELKDKPGHLLMAIRGGNEGDRTGKVPCWKWMTQSKDYGKTWSKLVPFTFSDGGRFWSPTSQAMFIRSSRTGKAYWIGNISRTRPRGGSPRYPLVIAELDEKKLGLKADTVTIIDDRGYGDGSDMQLSNFSFMEDTETGHILVTLYRYQGRASWAVPPTGVGYEGQVTYEIEVK